MQNILDEYYEIRETHDDKLSELTKRFNRICRIIIKFYDIKHAKYSYAPYDDSYMNQPLPDKMIARGIFTCNIEGDMDFDRVKHRAFEDLEYNSGFPVKFFNMKDDEIETYLLTQYTDYRTKERRYELKEQQRKRQIRDRRQKAIKKLTPNERKLLGVR